jgi:hypothetical protein
VCPVRIRALYAPGAIGGGGGDEYDQLMRQADAADVMAAQRATAAPLDVDLLKSIFGAKIGA